MCTGRPMQEGGIYTTDADIQPPRNPTNTKQSVMTCPILKRPADCTRPGPSRLSFTPKPRPKQCVGELEIPGLPSTTRTLFSGLRVSTHGKQAGPLVGFYHSAGRQPANSTPRPAGGGALSGLASSGIQKAMGSSLYLKKGGCVCQVETDGRGLYLKPYKGKGLQSYGDGLYLKQGGKLYYDGNGLLFGSNSPFANIPILGDIL